MVTFGAEMSELTVQHENRSFLTRRHSLGTMKRTRIFGGFPASFFAEYHKHLPKTKPESQYELRGHLYELFHYLNHTVIFEGGGYEFNALRKMDILIDAV
ncbi:fructosamine kinase pkl cak [Lentinula edodes]|uniref:Fructosamine kinase pkl cak n=1 Tax=Lentinula edodes TaxID=5353 RepID=A0A1Q3EIR5_LENED|nr:fructosamine kinase pkl cak [Lentinula edodes]